MRIRFDPRFVEIEHELWALGEYLQWVEPQIEELRLKDKERIEKELSDQGLPWDDADVQVAYQEIQERAENVFPRFLRGPFLTALWASYESGVKELADNIARSQSLDLRLKNIQGKHFVDEAERYFNTVLEIFLDQDDGRLERIADLLQIRNIFAHANGQERGVPKEKRPKIADLLSRNGIGFVDGYLNASPEYLARAFEDVDGSLRTLVNKVRGGPAFQVDRST